MSAPHFVRNLIVEVETETVWWWVPWIFFLPLYFKLRTKEASNPETAIRADKCPNQSPLFLANKLGKRQAQTIPALF
jgi:hypothetical protein